MIGYSPKRAQTLLTLAQSPVRLSKRRSVDGHVCNVLAGEGLVVVRDGIASITPAGKEQLADWVSSALWQAA